MYHFLIGLLTLGSISSFASESGSVEALASTNYSPTQFTSSILFEISKDDGSKTKGYIADYLMPDAKPIISEVLDDHGCTFDASDYHENYVLNISNQIWHVWVEAKALCPDEISFTGSTRERAGTFLSTEYTVKVRDKSNRVKEKLIYHGTKFHSRTSY